MRLVLEGDEPARRAFSEWLIPVIHERVGRKVMGTRSASKIRDEICDITSHVFLELFEENLDGLRAWSAEGGRSLSNWVGWLARHRAADYHRSRAKSWERERHGELEPGEEYAAALAGDGAASALERDMIEKDFIERVLETFRAEATPLTQRMFDLLFKKHLGTEEICKAMGMNRDAVHKQRARILEELGAIGERLRSGRPPPGGKRRKP